MFDTFRNFARFPNGGGGRGGRPVAFGDPHDNTKFDTYLYCYSASMAGKTELEKGNKILLPPDALQTLAGLNVSWPMLFEISSASSRRKTHCGVLEFVAEPGCCNLPYWMMRNLGVEEGDFVRVTNTSLPKGTFVKLQPVTSDFLDITNPKAVLENSLRHFAALTVGDCIALNYNDRTYEIEIVECRPADAISVIETDVDVDFAPPKDYVEPPPPPLSSTMMRDPSFNKLDQSANMESETSSDDEPAIKFNVFGGQGNRLDGRPGTQSPSVPTASEPVLDEEPWLRAIPGGVRTSNARYNELVARGTIKVPMGRSPKQVGLFQGVGRCLRD